jgi:hypothetical protein
MSVLAPLAMVHRSAMLAARLARFCLAIVRGRIRPRLLAGAFGRRGGGARGLLRNCGGGSRDQDGEHQPAEHSHWDLSFVKIPFHYGRTSGIVQCCASQLTPAVYSTMEKAFMNLKHALAAAFLSTFALATVAQAATPTDAPLKGAAEGKKVADKDGGGKKVEDKDGDKDDKGDAKKDGKKDHKKHHDHKKKDA